MEEKRFNPEKLAKLNNPERRKDFPVDRIAALVGFQDNITIVDLGAGTAFQSIPLAEMYPNSTIFALDISEIMTNWTKENIEPKYSNIKAITMDDSQIPMEDEAVDFLFTVNLHHELDNPQETLNECFRVLKNGAAIAISDWRKEQSDRGPGINLRYEPQQVSEQLINSGFKSIEIFTDLPNNFLVIARK